MEEQNIRMAIDRHWAASAAGDQVAEHEIYHDDTVCEYPQSGEVIHGRRNLQALRSHHPGRPSGFEVRRIVGEGNFWVTEYVITYEGKRAYTVSIIEFRDGKVSHETQYFADPFDAPAWRAQWASASPSTPTTPTVKMLAIGTITPGSDPAAVRAILPTEVRETVKLYSMARSTSGTRCRTGRESCSSSMSRTSRRPTRCWRSSPWDKPTS